MNAVEGMTMIGKSVKITGDVSGSEDFTMDGELLGTIQLSGARLTLGPAARVQGDVGARDVVIFGRLDGDVRAPGRVELRSTAIVQGNIYAGMLVIEDNAALRGEVDPSRAQEPMPAKQDGHEVTVAVPAALAALRNAMEELESVEQPDAGPHSDGSAEQASSLFAETEV